MNAVARNRKARKANSTKENNMSKLTSVKSPTDDATLAQHEAELEANARLKAEQLAAEAAYAERSDQSGEAPASEKMSVETAKSWIGMAFGAITTFALRVYAAVKWFVSTLWQSLSMAVYSALSEQTLWIILTSSLLAASLFVGYVAITMAPVVTVLGVLAAIGHVTVELALVTTTAYAGAMAVFLFASRIYESVAGSSLFDQARNWMTTRTMRQASPAAAMAA